MGERVRSSIYAIRDPLKKTVFGYDHPLTDVERGKAVRTEQDVSVGAGDAQRSSDMIGCQGDGKLLIRSELRAHRIPLFSICCVE